VEAKDSETGAKGGAGAVYFLMLLLQFVQVAEYAVLPGAFYTIREDLGMTHIEGGIAGALIFVGIGAGSLLAGALFPRFGELWTVSCALALTVLGGALCASAPNAYALYASRFLCGLSHGPWCVFLPLWVDKYSPEGWKSLWMALYKCMTPAANLAGYAFVSLWVYRLKGSWRLAYAVIAGAFALLALIFVMLPARLRRTGITDDGLTVAGLGQYSAFWVLNVLTVCAQYCATGITFYAQTFFVYWGAGEENVVFYYVIIGTGVVFGSIAGGFVDDCCGGASRLSSMRVVFVLTLLSMAVGCWMLHDSWIRGPMELSHLNRVATLVFTTLLLFSSAIPSLVRLILGSVPESSKHQASSMHCFLNESTALIFGPLVPAFFIQHEGYPEAWLSIFAPAMCSPLILGVLMLCTRASKEDTLIPAL
jgi:MFS family permease